MEQGLLHPFCTNSVSGQRNPDLHDLRRVSVYDRDVLGCFASHNPHVRFQVQARFYVYGIPVESELTGRPYLPAQATNTMAPVIQGGVGANTKATRRLARLPTATLFGIKQHCCQSRTGIQVECLEQSTWDRGWMPVLPVLA
jgi:hypothetical protein